MITWDKIVSGVTAVVAGIAGAMGEWSIVLKMLAVMMSLDYATGVAVAICNKSAKTENGGLDSKVGFVGLVKKGLIIGIVLAATSLDSVVGGDGAVFQTLVAGYYIGNEGISIIENAALLGVPIPSKLRDMFNALRDKGDGKDEKK